MNSVENMFLCQIDYQCLAVLNIVWLRSILYVTFMSLIDIFYEFLEGNIVTLFANS